MIDKNICCGCTACQHICPVGCISMQEDIEGFLYPLIDNSKCIHCHKCEKICPTTKTTVASNETTTYVGYSTQADIRKQSSSGGIFSILANHIFEMNGIVIGAAFDDKYEVHHIAVEKENLFQLRGSKYVQSRLETIYPLIRQNLMDGKTVLFSGTECQVAGLKSYLGKDYENLYTIDILCHGVPSPKIWRKYLKKKEAHANSQINHIEFRNKTDGWKHYSVNFKFKNGSQDCIPYVSDPFMNMFLGNLDLRPSCYHCQFKKIPRNSDLTLGDCWGIDKLMPDMDDDKGTSVILVHSAKGQHLLDSVKDTLMIKQAQLDQVLPPNAASREPVIPHPNRKKYLKALEKNVDFDALYAYEKRNYLQKIVGLIKYLIRSKIHD